MEKLKARVRFIVYTAFVIAIVASVFWNRTPYDSTAELFADFVLELFLGVALAGIAIMFVLDLISYVKKFK